MFPPFDLTASGYEIVQTFGQLVYRHSETKVADFVILKVPSTHIVRAIATGVVRYEPDFHGFGPSLILTPKGYVASNTDFDGLEGLPRPGSVRFVFGHLDAASVQEKIETRYTALGNSDPGLAAEHFIARHPDNREVDVVAESNLLASTELGNGDHDSVFIAAFVGDPEAVTSFVNPLPFVAAGTPSASLAALDGAPPQIEEAAFYADDDPALLDPMIYLVPGSNRIERPNVLYKHIAIRARIADRILAAGEKIGIYEFSYEINRVTRDASDAITSRSLQSKGRYLANQIVPSASPVAADLYSLEHSSATARRFWYWLHFDPTTPPATDPPVRNYTQQGNARSLDVSAYPAGEYEFVLILRDVTTPTSTPVTHAVYAFVDNSSSSIASAQWKVRAAFGPQTAEADRNDEVSFLIIPGTTTPFAVQADLVNSPAGAYSYTLLSNGTDVTPTANTFTSPQTLTLAPGLSDLVVWLDQDGNGLREPSESSRRIVIMTYQVTLTVTAERKHLSAGYTALAAGTLVPSADGLRLTAIAGGFELGHEASAILSWEIVTPTGPAIVAPTPYSASAGLTWEKDPLKDSGPYEAKAVVTVFGVRVKDETWHQDVVGAQIASVDAVCEEQIRTVPVTVNPSPLPVGNQVDYAIEGPLTAADGDAVFTPINAHTTSGTGSGPLEVQGRSASSAADNLRIVARFDGAEIAREPFSTCGIRFLDANSDVTDTLRIGRWDNAYTGAFAVRPDFIDRDERRFHVRVIDMSKNSDPGVVESITVGELATLFGGGGVNDDFTVVDLIETGSNTGIFESVSQLLVSPDLPVAHNPDDHFLAPVADDVRGDQTHRVTTRGSVTFRYPVERDIAYADTLDVCTGPAGGPPWRRTLFLRIHVFDEPVGNDVNRDGAIGPVATPAEIDSEFARARVAWAQACIYVEVQAPQNLPRSQPAPADAAGANILLDGQIDVPGDVQAIGGAFGPGAQDDTLVVFWPGPFDSPTLYGLANIVMSGVIAPAVRVGMGDATFVYVRPLLPVAGPHPMDLRYRTLAHELGHALTNQVAEAANPQTVFFPFVIPPAWIPFDDRVNQQRRITRGTEADSRTWRGPSPADPGNRLLKNF